MAIASSQIWTPGDSPGPAPAGKRRLYVNLATGNLVIVDDAGNETDISSSGTGSSASLITTPTITSPAEGATNVASDITSSTYATDTLFSGAHESSDWEFSLSADFSTIDHASYADTVHLTAYPSSLLSPGTTYYARVRYNSDNHRSAWSPAVSFATAATSVATPTVTVTGEPDAVPETPTISTTAFSSTDANETHLSTDWQVVDSNGTVVWESPADTANLESVSVPAGVLQTGTTYVFRARHNGSVTSSLYGETTATTAATFAQPTFLGDTALFAGGDDGSDTAAIESLNIAVLGNAVSFGLLSLSRSALSGGASDGSKAVFTGGYDIEANTAGVCYTTMDYCTFSTAGDALLWGDMQTALKFTSTVSDSATGYILGGRDVNDVATSEISSFTLSTAGNTNTFGNLLAQVSAHSGCSGSSRIISAGGYDGAASVSSIEYIDPASATTASSFGNLTEAKHSMSSASNTAGRCVFSCGYTTTYLSTIEFIDSGTIANATLFGNSIEARYGCIGASNDSRMVFAEGYGAAGYLTSIEYIDFNTIADSNSFGSTVNAIRRAGSASGN